MKFQIITPHSVQKEIRKIDKRSQEKIIKTFLSLARDPYIGKKLKGSLSGYWCFRVWPYRIIYRIEKNKLLVIVVRLGHRQGIYK